MPVTPNVSTGNGLDFLAGRVSYTFGLTGAAPYVASIKYMHCCDGFLHKLFSTP